MAVITPRNGATLAQVVQTALNVAGRTGVSIETGGTGNGVRVPDAHLAAIEAELGWTEAEGKPLDPEPTQAPTLPPTPATTQVEGSSDPDNPDASDSSDSDPDTTDDTEEPAAVAAPARKSAPAKKTTSSRRARRGKEG